MKNNFRWYVDTFDLFLQYFFFFKVFAICDYDHSEQVGCEEMIKFLEAIAELEGGEEAVDLDAAQTVVRQIMEFCGKESDKEEITKEEFIAWFVFSLMTFF